MFFSIWCIVYTFTHMGDFLLDIIFTLGLHSVKRWTDLVFVGLTLEDKYAQCTVSNIITVIHILEINV